MGGREGMSFWMAVITSSYTQPGKKKNKGRNKPGRPLRRGWGAGCSGGGRRRGGRGRRASGVTAQSRPAPRPPRCGRGCPPHRQPRTRCKQRLPRLPPPRLPAAVPGRRGPAAAPARPPLASSRRAQRGGGAGPRREPREERRWEYAVRAVTAAAAARRGRIKNNS